MLFYAKLSLWVCILSAESVSERSRLNLRREIAELPMLCIGFLIFARHSLQPTHERGHGSKLPMASEKEESRRLILLPGIHASMLACDRVELAFLLLFRQNSNKLWVNLACRSLIRAVRSSVPPRGSAVATATPDYFYAITLKGRNTK